MATPETIEECVRTLRETVPYEFATEDFAASDTFFIEFDKFKAPLIAYLANSLEADLRTASASDPDEVMRGYTIGAINTIISVAQINLVKREA